ncbi:MAG: hypothetical protein HY922_01815 [Elusimicrobia bacterium]|nr:hypothetical protein [Elusimicrobiota bacterium]
MAAHPEVAALVMFRKGDDSGYLRICGRAEPVDDYAERKRIADAAAFSLEYRWKGASDPNLSFVRIAPERIEYMRPGDDGAKDVTVDLLPGVAK